MYLPGRRRREAAALLSTMLHITTLITVFSQFPFVIYAHSSARVLMYSAWLFLFAVSLCTMGPTFLSKANSRLVYAFLAFLTYCLTMHILMGDGYINGMYLRPVFTSIFCYMMGDLASRFLAPTHLKRLLYVYVFAVVCVAAYLYTAYFSDIGSWLEAQTYAYGAKNSIGPIIGSAIIVLAYGLAPINLARRALRLGLIASLLLVLVLLENRAGIVSLTSVYLATLLRSKERRLRHWLPVLLFVALMVLAGPFSAAIHKSLQIRKLGLTDANALSSGRVEQIAESGRMFLNQPLTGTGNWYVDSFPISILTEMGIVGAMPAFAMLFILVRSNLSGEVASLARLVKALMAFALVQCVFEGLPPFGPGVCYFLLWLLSGYRTALKGERCIYYTSHLPSRRHLPGEGRSTLYIRTGESWCAAATR
jgi:hypothetical protein